MSPRLVGLRKASLMGLTTVIRWKTFTSGFVLVSRRIVQFQEHLRSGAAKNCSARKHRILFEVVVPMSKGCDVVGIADADFRDVPFADTKNPMKMDLFVGVVEEICLRELVVQSRVVVDRRGRSRPVVLMMVPVVGVAVAGGTALREPGCRKGCAGERGV